MASHRVGRTAEDIKRELTDIIRTLKDPRIKGILSIVGIDLASDLSYASVYISSLDGFEAAKSSVKGLSSANGYIKRELGMRMDLRKIPELKFIPDNSIEHSAHISELLNSEKRKS
ncbi:MAG: ribosome-binding factor A [Clostridiales bacterium 43-6]|nr:MAG: ribosome-binding factor A [Clostridiales bacterium 43-6]